MLAKQRFFWSFRLVTIFLSFIFFMFSGFLYSDVSVTGLAHDAGADNAKLQSKSVTWTFSCSSNDVSSAPVDTISRIDFDFLKVVDGDDDQSIASLLTIESATFVVNGTETPLSGTGMTFTGNIPSLVANFTIKVKVSLKSLSTGATDSVGFNLAGNTIYPKVTLSVVNSDVSAGNVVSVVFPSSDGAVSTAQKVFVKGISGFEILRLRGKFPSLARLFPSENAVMLMVSLNIPAGTDDLKLSSLQLYKQVENDDALKKVLLVRRDYLATLPNFTNEIAYPSPNTSVLQDGGSDLIDSLDGSVLTNSLLSFSSIDMPLLSGGNRQAFYVIYLLKDNLTLPTVNYKCKLNSFVLKDSDDSLIDLNGAPLIDESRRSQLVLGTDIFDYEPEMEFEVVGFSAMDLSKPGIQTAGDPSLQNIVFGAANKNIPILSFKMKAFQNPMDLKSLIIRSRAVNDENDQGFFTFGSEGYNKINKVYLYKDQGVVGDFDSADELLFSANVENDSPNTYTLDLSSVPIVFSLDSDRNFILAYDIGAGLMQQTSNGNKVQALIAGATAVLNSAVENGFAPNIDIALSGVDADTPATALETAESVLFIQASVVSLVDTHGILPALSFSSQPIYEGQRQLPFLQVRLKNDTSPITDATISFGSGNDADFSSSYGVKRLYLYNEAGVLLGSQKVTDFVSNSFNLSDIFLPQTTFQGADGNDYNTLTIKADIGQKASQDSLFNMQFTGISGQNITFAGLVPQPLMPVTFNVTAFPLQVTANVVSGASINNDPGGVSPVMLNMYLKNNGSIPIKLVSVTPKVYFEKIDGIDISGSFNFDRVASSDDFNVAENDTLIIAPNTLKRISRRVMYKDVVRYYTGVAYLDADFRFKLENRDEDNFDFQRYEESEDIWKTNLSFYVDGQLNPANGVLVLKQEDQLELGMYPSYISAVYYRDIYHPENRSFTSEDRFFTRTAVQEGGHFCIDIVSGNVSLDYASLELRYQGEVMTQLASGVKNIFGYYVDRALNRITIYQLPGTDGEEGEILMTVNDDMGNTLDVTQIKFMSSTNLRSNRALFYPNPFVLDQTDKRLTFGLNLSKKATLDFYVFNHNGRFIWSSQIPLSNTRIGYNYFSHEFLALENVLTPGMYVCKVLITDVDGVRISKSVQLVVY
ncbi:MAG: hypothetical protein VW378_06225 [bacterium]